MVLYDGCARYWNSGIHKHSYLGLIKLGTILLSWTPRLPGRKPTCKNLLLVGLLKVGAEITECSQYSYKASYLKNVTASRNFIHMIIKIQLTYPSIWVKEHAQRNQITYRRNRYTNCADQRHLLQIS